jgi:hypothetical protein
MNSKNIVVLTGGLGNQLFQIARGLYCSPNGKIIVDSSLGVPRLNREKLPEVSSLFNDIIYENRNAKQDYLSNKVFNFALRFGISSNGKKLQRILIPIIELFCSIAFIALRREGHKFAISCGIGFDRRIQDRSALQVGYFQTYKWLEKSQVAEKLRSIQVTQEGENLKQLRQIAPHINPLIVHCRFGDYKTESDFGIPGSEYYEKSLDCMFSIRDFSEIWVFSDEINLARMQIPQKYHGRVRWIEDVDNSSAASLDAMRLGNGFVIANSTFSWWGAMLRKNIDAPVIAPAKWFKNAEDPADLIPESWIRIDPW